MSLQTEYPFTLPKGYVDAEGTLHKRGTMRLATARDEIEPMRDARVQENEAYLTIVILARVVSSLGTLTHINPKVIEDLFASDIAYLQDLYGIINFGDPEALASLDEASPFDPATIEEAPTGVS